jgi:hypothetical protein
VETRSNHEPPGARRVRRKGSAGRPTQPGEGEAASTSTQSSGNGGATRPAICDRTANGINAANDDLENGHLGLIKETAPLKLGAAGHELDLGNLKTEIKNLKIKISTAAQKVVGLESK